MSAIAIEELSSGDLDGLVELVAAEGWTEYSDDPDQTHRALTAPGATTVAASVPVRAGPAGLIESTLRHLCDL